MAEGPIIHYYTKRLKEVFDGRDVRIEFLLKKLKEFERYFQNIRIQK
jgi:hypothetical protein